MVFEILSVAGKWATILLALEAFLISLLPLFILYQMVRGLRRLVPKVAPTLRSVHQAMVRVSRGIQRAMAILAAPFIWGSSFMARLRASAVGLRRIVQGR